MLFTHVVTGLKREVIEEEREDMISGDGVDSLRDDDDASSNISYDSGTFNLLTFT